jgi:hypothetical protein
MATGLSEPEHQPLVASRRVDDAVLITCALSWAAGVIHVVAAIGHLSEYVPYAVAFELLASAQLVWGFALYRAPSARPLSAGAIVNVLVVAVWIASRTSGLPIGPEAWRAEDIGALDAICSADEVVLALLAVTQLAVANGSTLLRVTRRVAATGGVALLLLSSLVLTAAGQAHVH